ncbi:MAG TPA: helix-turn-helix transcriptional regulator [Thermoanaerobaculia bacterium]|nr:helix-turn-helix transcriptional regulator [Thermoanaerobaculia bacterium]
MSPEAKHLLDVIRALIRAQGYKDQEVAAKLGLSDRYLSRLFAGKIELRFEHLVDVARVLGLKLEELFQIAYPRVGEPSPAFQRYLMVAAASGAQPSSPPSLSEEDMERHLVDALSSVLAAAMTTPPLSPPSPPPPPPQPVMPGPEEMEKIMERMLRQYFAGSVRKK